MAHKILMADALVGNDYSFYLCHYLQKSGLNVELITTEDRQSSVPVNFTLLPWMPSKNPQISKISKIPIYLKYLVRLFFYLKNSRVRAVHFQFFRKPRIEALFLGCLKLLPVKIIYTIHDIFPPETKKIDAYFVRKVYKSADKLIVHSNYIKQQIVSLFHLNPAKISVVPHGDFDFYLPEKNISREEAKQKLGWQPDDFIFLFFGYIREYKGVDILMEAASPAISQNNKIKIIIAGSVFPPELAEQYQYLADKFPYPNHLQYHPDFIPSEKVADYFSAADMLVLPYRNIYHSGVLHLAYSFGLPVLATGVGDFPESVEEGKSGFLVPAGDAEMLGQKMLDVAQNKAKVQTMGRYARELSEKKYSWKNAAQLTRNVYLGND